ncbi:protein sip-5 [Pseudoxanthomonas daejeonensis]|uniref:Protein sip-5 n=1 Tax=Pseudoxanthomonas daejeonensis TaxID=266062 RepID=A0ABQ6Z3M5_9GAMM|nr:protein sip-5 [Pseudoxanthomonas daejeonensis]KAF1692206.1 protein sip-5 [Pseudoxanthomonas daejeonensis]UNK56266.1 protein sip-5 [Pseudoxanthomonas daejeonensis]
MRFELLRQRVERAERRVESCMDRAQVHRQEFGQAWRRGWSPGRIVIAGLLSGFLVGRAEPLSKVGGTRWLQMLGTVSSMLASLQAAAASHEAGEAADVAAQEAAAANQNVAEATGQAPVAPVAPVPAASDPLRTRAPAPAEAATDVSER